MLVAGGLGYLRVMVWRCEVGIDLVASVVVAVAVYFFLAIDKTNPNVQRLDRLQRSQYEF